jgi:hypothetical protein
LLVLFDGVVMILDDNTGLQRLRRTESVFIGAPFSPDAVFIIPDTSYVYFIRG